MIASTKILAIAISSTCATAAVSDDARYIRQLSQDVREQMESSITFGADIQQLRQDLCSTFEEASELGWDGYGASAVSEDTYRAAYAFIESIPPGIELPTVSADPTGYIEFEWYRNPQRLLSVSITEEGQIYFASIVGCERDSGSRMFSGAIPERILQLIGDVCAA